jgi:hypothetical protein
VQVQVQELEPEQPQPVQVLAVLRRRVPAQERARGQEPPQRERVQVQQCHRRQQR